MAEVTLVMKTWKNLLAAVLGTAFAANV